MLKKRNQELFNDGVLEVYSTDRRTVTGLKRSDIRYGLRTVGVNRFYQSKLADSQVDQLISVPINAFIGGDDLIIIDGIQYEIGQIQKKYDTSPASMYISLKEALPMYEVEES